MRKRKTTKAARLTQKAMTIESVGRGRTCRHQCDLTCPTVPVCCGTGREPSQSVTSEIFPPITTSRDFPGGPVVKDLPSKAACACLCAESLQSCPTLCEPARLLCPWDSPGKDAGVGCHALLQGIFPTQGSNPCFIRLLPWQAVLYTSNTQCRVHGYNPWSGN